MSLQGGKKMKGPIFAIAVYGLLYTSRSFHTRFLGASGVSDPAGVISAFIALRTI